MIEGHVLGEESDAPAGMRIAKGTAEHLAMAVSWPHETHGQVNRGGLTRAVWSQKAEDFTGLDAQGKVIQRADGPAGKPASVLLRDSVVFENSRHRGPILRSLGAALDDKTVTNGPALTPPPNFPPPQELEFGTVHTMARRRD